MQEQTMCYSGSGKDDKKYYIPRWTTNQNYPDYDKKRIHKCKVSNTVVTKKSTQKCDYRHRQTKYKVYNHTLYKGKL